MMAQTRAQQSGPFMVTGFGQSDTHALEIETENGTTPNPHPCAGQDYTSITGRDIAQMAANPDNREKQNAPWFIGSDYVAHDARSHAAQRQNGSFHVLPADIDKGGPSLDQVISASRKVAGDGASFIVYSSSSATPDTPKWRVLFFVSPPISGADYRDTQDAIFDLFAQQGIICDRALNRTGQLIFLPNVPPARRDSNGEPLFYQYHLERGKTLNLASDHQITTRREAVRAEIEAAAKEAKNRRARSVTRSQDDQASPIEIFNERHSLIDLMEKYGYQRQGSSSHWRSPNQTSGSYAVKVFEDRAWVSLSGSDQAAGIGAQKEYCCFGDAFDLFVHYEHGGNQTAAVRAYGQEVRPSAVVVPLRPTDDAHDMAKDFGDPSQGEVDSPKPRRKPTEPSLEDWVFLSGDNEFYHAPTGRTMGLTAFNLSMSPFTPKVEIVNSDGEITEKKFSASKTLIDYLKGTVAHSTMYRPDLSDQGQDVFYVGGVPFINSYMQDSVPGVDEGWAQRDEWRTCEQHIRNILGDNAPLIIQWMAHNVQKPGVKILWAPIIVGVQGDGKTTLAKMLGAAMGSQNVCPVSPETMFSDFTGWAEGACVKVLEEIRVHGNSRHDAMNKLKPLITNDTVEIVRKGKDGKQVVNVTNYMALTNHMDALALDDGDRRWGVFKTKFDDRADMLAEFDDDYWEALHKAIDRHPGVIRGWLMSVSLVAFNRVAGPEISDHKKAMIRSTRSPDQIDVEEAIACGWHGVTDTVLATDCLNAAILSSTGQRLNGKRISNALEAAGWIRVNDTVKWNGRNRRLWWKKEARLGAATPAELRTILDTSEAFDGI